MNTPVFTGLDALDKLTGGFKPGELIILGARPAIGKTSFALNLLENAGLREKQNCLMLSLEMGTYLISRRLFALHTGEFHVHKDITNELDRFVWKYMDEGPVWVDGKPVHGMDELTDRLHAVHDLRFAVIDYLQLLACPVDMSACLTRLKTLALELSVPIILLSQINQFPDFRTDKRPTISDLRWVSDVAPVDQVLFLYRDDYYNRDAAQYNIAEFILAKHPEGRSGTAKVLFRYTPQGFLVYCNDCQGEPVRSRGNGKPIIVGRTKRGAEISICDHCEAYPAPHFNLAYGKGKEEALWFDAPKLVDSIGNLDLTTRMDLQDFLTTENWSRMISLWNENNKMQLSPYTHIPYYINLIQYQDCAAPLSRREIAILGASVYVMEDQDQRPHFHYKRFNASPGICISLTEPKYLPPVPSPLSERELDRLLKGLTMADEKFGTSLYQRLLMAWNMQNETKVDEERDMPDYRELGAQEV